MIDSRRANGVARVTLGGAVFLAVFSTAGYFAATWLPVEFLASLLRWTTGLIGIVWLFSLNIYNKLSDVTDAAGLDYRQHQNLELEVRSRLQWFWVRAMFLAVLAIALNFPSMLTEAKLGVPRFVFAISTGALGVALFSLRGILRELEDIRQLRSHVKEMERREKERAEKVKNLTSSTPTEWEADPVLDGFRSGQNRPN